MVGMGLKLRNRFLVFIVLFVIPLGLSSCGSLTPSPKIDLPEVFTEKSGYRISFGPVWAPDDKAFFWQGSVTSLLYRTDVETKETLEIDINGIEINNLYVSGDGKTLYFAENINAYRDPFMDVSPCLYQYSLETAKLEPHLCDAFATQTQDIVINFFPHDSQLVYQLNQNLYLYDLSTKTSQLILDIANSNYGSSLSLVSYFDSLSISPDGNQILLAYLSSNTSERVVVTLNPGTGDLKHFPLPSELYSKPRYLEVRWTSKGILLLSHIHQEETLIYNLSTEERHSLQGPISDFWQDFFALQDQTCLQGNWSGSCIISQWDLKLFNRQSGKETTLARNDSYFPHSLSNDLSKIVFFAFNSQTNSNRIYLEDISKP